MGQLKLKDLYIGKTDGYNEFLAYGSSICRHLFFEYPNIDIQKILDGSVYYICGDKGTGKTMLLKYIESLISDDSTTNFSEFIRFKKDVDEDQRNQLKRAALPQAPFEEIIEKEIPSDSTIDCVLAWQVYLIKVIINRLRATEYGVFLRNSEWDKLCALLSSVYKDDPDTNALKKILPKVKRGSVEVSAKNIAKFDLDLEWTDDSKKSVSFISLGKKIIDLYSSLAPCENRVYIFIDELELSLKKTKNYERDITLIRDLIFAVQYMNEISKQNGYNVFLISAIRNEVYQNVKSKGLEINKPIHDFGFQIDWRQKTENIQEHPLLKMLARRFQYSEECHNLLPTSDIYSSYFLSEVGRSKVPICNYILDQTWYRPRDIIRLFSIIQSVAGDKNYIDQQTFDSVKQRYSEESWAEFEEILSVKYSDREVQGIKIALTGLQVPFSVSDFGKSISGKSSFYEEVELLKKKNFAFILRDLYDIGVIGNYCDFPRFSFKSEDGIDPLLPLTFHYPLLRYFKASVRPKETHLISYN